MNYSYMSLIQHGAGPPYYHPQHGSGGMGQIERSTSNPTQHQRQPDVNWNPIVTYGVERRSDVGFDGSIGDGSKADRVCGLRPSCVTPTQPHRRHSATPSSVDTEAPMLALPLRLPTAPYGGHMGHFLLSILALMPGAQRPSAIRHHVCVCTGTNMPTYCQHLLCMVPTNNKNIC